MSRTSRATPVTLPRCSGATAKQSSISRRQRSLRSSRPTKSSPDCARALIGATAVRDAAPRRSPRSRRRRLRCRARRGALRRRGEQHVRQCRPTLWRGLDSPLQAMGLGCIAPLLGVDGSRSQPPHMVPCSPLRRGRTVHGHWELCGVHLEGPFPVYPAGFPTDRRRCLCARDRPSVMRQHRRETARQSSNVMQRSNVEREPDPVYVSRFGFPNRCG